MIYQKNILTFERVYNEKYLKAKIKHYNGKINTNFHSNKVTKKGSQFICVSVIFFVLLLENVKVIIFTRFQKNVNILLKKKKDVWVYYS